MNRLLIFAAVAETATGLALLVVPSTVAELLLGAALTGVATSLARVAGAALIGLGVACWPGPARLGMAIYGLLVALLLTTFGLAGDVSGVLLWPAVVVHLILSALLFRLSTTGSDAKSQTAVGRH